MGNLDGTDDEDGGLLVGFSPPPVMGEEERPARIAGPALHRGAGARRTAIIPQPEKEDEPDAWKSVPFWGEFADRPDARIRVQWLDPRTGTPENLGHIGINAGEAELLHTWPRSGRFMLWLESIDGTRLSETPKPVVIGDGHLVLQQIKAGGAASGTPAAGSHIAGAGSNPVLEMMLKQLMEQNAKREAELAAREAKLAEDRLKVEELNRGAVAIMTERSAAVNDRVLEQSAKLAEENIKGLTGNFQGIIAMNQQLTQAALAQQNAQNEAFLARMQAQAETEKRAAEERAAEAARRAAADIEAMRERTKQEQQRLDAEAAERRDRLEREERRMREDAERREKEREKLMQEERERQREHAEKMTKLESERRDPMTTTIATITTLLGVAKEIGLDPATLLKPKEEAAAPSGGIMETLINAAGPVLAEGVKAWAAVNGGGAAEEEDEEGENEDPELLEDPNEIVTVQTPDGKQTKMTRAQMHQITQQEMQRQQAAAAQAAQAAQAPVAGGAGNIPPPHPEKPVEFAPPAWGGAGTPAPQGATVAAGSSPLLPMTPDGAPPTVQGPPIAELLASLSTAEKKSARAAGRQLVAKLAAEPEAAWPGLITGTVMANAALRKYIELASLEGALEDLGVTQQQPALAAQIIAVAVAKVPEQFRKFIRRGGV